MLSPVSVSLVGVNASSSFDTLCSVIGRTAVGLSKPTKLSEENHGSNWITQVHLKIGHCQVFVSVFIK